LKPVLAAYFAARSILTGSSLKMIERGMTGFTALGADILDAADVIDDDLLARIVEEGVEGEIAAEDILLHRPVGVAHRTVREGAEGGDLEDLGAEEHVHQAEATPDDPGVAEDPLDARRSRIGDDVEVLGSLPDHEVADGAADNVGFMA
jgi:hypothetical protein